jgi:hypothetical protein
VNREVVVHLFDTPNRSHRAQELGKFLREHSSAQHCASINDFNFDSTRMRNYAAETGADSFRQNRISDSAAFIGRARTSRGTVKAMSKVAATHEQSAV